MNRYSYLNNPDFLMKAFQEKSLHQYIKITVLSFSERPIKEIQGKVTSGNININGDSSVRRTANLSVFIEEGEADYAHLQSLFSINKKVRIEIGISNMSKDYSEFPILWFPFGVFALMGISLSHDTNGTNASLQLKDKMVFLNGECGGTLPASVTFHEYDILDPSLGEYVRSKPTIVQIIRELVNHFGGEALHRIVINDLDTRVKRVMKWIANTPLYISQVNKDGSTFVLYTDDLQQIKEDLGKENLVLNEDYQEYSYGTDVGFTYGDFTYPGELIGNAGDSVCTILDTIKNTLGNYEYYYDVYGNFIFQEIKNYLNTSKTTVDLKYMNQENYLINRYNGQAKYVFNNNNIMTSFSNAPQYNMIKNDFIVWGMRESVNGNKIPIRYHLSIDSKPKTGNTYCCYIQKDENGFSYAKIPIEYNSGLDFPVPGEVDRVYLDKSNNKLYIWDKKSEGDIGSYLYSTDAPAPVPYNSIVSKEFSITEKDKINLDFYASNYCCLSAPKEVEEKDNAYKDYEIKLEEYKTTQKQEEELKEKINTLQRQLSEINNKIKNEGANEGLLKKREELVAEAITIEKKLTELYEQYGTTLEQSIVNIKNQLQELKIEIFKTQQSFSKDIGFGASTITTNDWRSELYLSGTMTTRYGTNANYYFTELSNEWPKLYDIEKGQFKQEVLDHPEELDYYLDFIDSTAAISELSISNIGRRTKIVNDEKINCIFETEIPDYIIIETGKEDTNSRKEECQIQGQKYVQVNSRVFDNLALGGSLNSAYNMIRELLYQYTNYNEAITVQMLPLYFLEPNIRISVQDKESGIRGDYMIQSISIPFDVNGTMSLSCTRALERI